MAHRFFRAFPAHSGKQLRSVPGANVSLGALPRAAARAAKLARQQAGMAELKANRAWAARPPGAARTNHYRQCHLLGESFPSSRMTPGDAEVHRLPAAPEPIAAPNFVFAHLGEPWPSTRWEAAQPDTATSHEHTVTTWNVRVRPASELHRAISETATAIADGALDDVLALQNYSACQMAERDGTAQGGGGITISAHGDEDAAAAIRAAMFAAVDPVAGGSERSNGVVETATPVYRQFLAQQVALKAKQRQQQSQQSQQTSIASQPANATAATHWGGKNHPRRESCERRDLSSSRTHADDAIHPAHASDPVLSYGAQVALPHNSQVGSPGRKWGRLGWCLP